MLRSSFLNNLFKERSFFLFFLASIVLLGFVLSPTASDYSSMKAGGSATSKLFRVITILFTGYTSFITLCLYRKLGYILRGHLAIFFCYFCLASISILYSQFWQMTAFKSFEIISIIMIAATVYLGRNPEKVSVQYVHFIFIFYVVITFGIWLQFALFGPEAQRQLVQETPFFNFMLSSRYPFLVGNAVGYLGALVCLFGLYFMDARTVSSNSYRILGSGVSMLGFITTVFSYTRSVLLFLICTIALYCFLCKKNKYLLWASISIVLSLLVYPEIYQKLLIHLQRGQSVDTLSTMSGRANLWQNVLQGDIINILLGRGFATGSLYKDFEMTGSVLTTVNVHNTILEIINFIGLGGVATWLYLMASLGKKLCLFYRTNNSFKRRPDAYFHNFMFSIFMLSILRSMMNVTFARLDLFMFVLVAMVLYCDNLSPQLNSQQ